MPCAWGAGLEAFEAQQTDETDRSRKSPEAQQTDQTDGSTGAREPALAFTSAREPAGAGGRSASTSGKSQGWPRLMLRILLFDRREERGWVGRVEQIRASSRRADQGRLCCAL